MAVEGKHNRWYCHSEELKHFKGMLVFFTLNCALILAFQSVAWMAKIHRVPPEVYSTRAVDLKVADDLRYGYLLSFHGAYLAKTDNVEPAVPAGRDEETETGRQDEVNEEGKKRDVSGLISQPEEEDRSVEEAMRRELELVPVKAVLETIWYLAALVMLVWGPFCLIRLRFLPSFTLSGRAFWAAVLSGAAYFWTMAAPLLLLDYGPPLFSTWVGPGALSYSTGTQLISFGGGMTVSYRNVIEMLVFWPSAFYFYLADIIPDWAQDFMFFGIFAPSFYGGLWGICKVISRPSGS